VSNVETLRLAEAEPNPEVVSALEFLLEEARAGRLGDVALVANLPGNEIFTFYSADDCVVTIGQLMRAIHRLQIRMDGSE
jgi:hypothetical protein